MKTFVSQKSSRVKLEADESALVLEISSVSLRVAKEAPTPESAGQGPAGGRAAC